MEIPWKEEAEGTVSVAAVNGKAIGYIVFRDTLRTDVDDTFSALRKIGAKRILVLTGDNRREAAKIAAEITADETLSELLPEQKLEKVRAEKQAHTVVVVGDGINDSLALSEANVGIAMGAMGSDTAIQSADIALMNNDLMNLPFIVLLARNTRSVIYQNMMIAFVTSFVMILLAAAGLISPVLGAFLHNAGAFIVLLNSARVARGDYTVPEETPGEPGETEASE